jgi:dynein heavy chain
MKQKSSAAAGLCEWVINIVEYYNVIQTVEPKRKALKEATEQLEAATEKLKVVEATVKELNDKLNKLTE